MITATSIHPSPLKPLGIKTHHIKFDNHSSHSYYSLRHMQSIWESAGYHHEEDPQVWGGEREREKWKK